MQDADWQLIIAHIYFIVKCKPILHPMERIYVLGIVALFVSVPLAELACMELKLATLAVVAAIVE